VHTFSSYPDTFCCRPPSGSCKGRYQMVTTTVLSHSGRSGVCRQ
jgi:hypothetical protein